MLNRLEEPSSGCIKFHGTDVRTLDVRVLRRRVGLLGQRPIMLSRNVRSEVSFAAPQLSDDGVAELLRRVGLPGFAFDRPTVDLSGGEQQRLALARALAVEPEVLLLDEPTSGLDGVAAAAVDSVIRALVADGLTVVLVSHDLTRAGAITDNARVLKDGRLVDRGDPTTVHYLRDE
jgi:putative ABC transport system ATP-binding protein